MLQSNPARGILLVAGALPGARNGLIKIRYSLQTLPAVRDRKPLAAEPATEEETPPATEEQETPEATVEAPEAAVEEQEAKTEAAQDEDAPSEEAEAPEEAAEPEAEEEKSS